jgi:hypothetical protein
MATKAKVWVCDPSIAGIAVSNRAVGLDVYILWVFSGIYLSVSRGSLVKRSPTECGVSECDREASTTRRTWPTRRCPGRKRSVLKSMNLLIMLFFHRHAASSYLAQIYTSLTCFLTLSIHVFYTLVKIHSQGK